VFLTVTPTLSPAGISMLSIPTPALIANLNFPPSSALNTSEVRVVADLITIASKSFNFSPNTSCSM